jgi:hypothetical protein
MRILALAILAIGMVSIGTAAAQMYDPAYPVCLHVYGRGANYYERGRPRGLSAASSRLLKLCRYRTMIQASPLGRVFALNASPTPASSENES